MMSTETIAQLGAEQSAVAARRKKKPATVFSKETSFEDASKAPWLGDYVHPKWKQLDVIRDHPEMIDVFEGYRYAIFADDGWPWLFVDKCGFGKPGEPALCSEELQELMPKLTEKAGELGITLGVGIVEEGEFQCHLGLYRRR